MKYRYEITFVNGSREILLTDTLDLTFNFEGSQTLIVDVDDGVLYINKKNIISIRKQTQKP